MNTILFNEKSGLLRSGWRAVIFLVVYGLFTALLAVFTQMLLSAMHINRGRGYAVHFVTNALVSLAPAIVIGWLCGKYLESLPYRTIGAAFSRGWLKHLSYGLVIGAFTLTLAVAIALAVGGLNFSINESSWLDIFSSAVKSFAVFAVAAAFEEALFRGYLLQTFARSNLAWLAILVTSAFFGAVHLGNPGANPISTANTILAGIWFSMAYLKTRDLWFVWGLHLMWNWMQGSFFGIEVSGLTAISSTPLLREIDTGPTWLTGQTYGVEGGIVCTIAIAISIAAIYLLPNLKPDPEILALNSLGSQPPGTQALSPATAVPPA